MLAYLQSHPLEAFAAYLVFMAVVDALPPSKETSAEWYKFTYQFGHLLSMNIKRFWKAKE